MFTSVTFFTSIDAVRGFAGEDYEQAVVEETARRALSRWDERVSHHDVARRPAVTRYVIPPLIAADADDFTPKRRCINMRVGCWRVGPSAGAARRPATRSLVDNRSPTRR